MLIEVKFLGDNTTKPHIDEGTILLMVQGDQVQIARFDPPGNDDWSFWLDHPLNGAELVEEAEQTIAEVFPNYKSWESSRLFICPNDLALRTVWR